MGGHGWVNDALDESRFESDEEELEAIQNMVKSQNSQIIFEESTTEEKAVLDETKFESDEEELQAIQNMIKSQNEGTLFESKTIDEKVTDETTDDFSKTAKEKYTNQALDNKSVNKDEESMETSEFKEELVN